MEANDICVRPLNLAHNKELALAGLVFLSNISAHRSASLGSSLQELHLAQCDS